tara:strand:- start:698 stop:1111 length:414 start_codon:yes stop_codon:yes gene_type:complete
MPFTDAQFKKEMIDGQRRLSKLIADVAGEVSTIKNNQQFFEIEMRTHLESNPRTHQKGLVETVSGNTNDIVSLKTRTNAVRENVKENTKQIKTNTFDISLMKTDWKVLMGKAGAGIAIFAGIGAVLWKLLGFVKSFV